MFPRPYVRGKIEDHPQRPDPRTVSDPDEKRRGEEERRERIERGCGREGAFVVEFGRLSLLSEPLPREEAVVGPLGIIEAGAQREGVT